MRGAQVRLLNDPRQGEEPRPQPPNHRTTQPPSHRLIAGKPAYLAKTKWPVNDAIFSAKLWQPAETAAATLARPKTNCQESEKLYLPVARQPQDSRFCILDAEF